jgi:hypothetical protein
VNEEERSRSNATPLTTEATRTAAPANQATRRVGLTSPSLVRGPVPPPVQQLVDTLVAVGRPLFETFRDQLVEHGGDAGAPCRGGRGFLGHFRREDLLWTQALKRGDPREHLVAQDPEGIDVGPVVDVGVGRSLFGSHVDRCADRDSGRREAVGTGGLKHRFGHAEVGDQRVPPGQQDVVGLDVAVHDSATVREGQGIGDLAQDPGGILDRQLALTAQSLAQGSAVDEWRDVIGGVRHLARIDEPEDVRVLECGDRPDLKEKPFGAHGSGQLGFQDLDRDLAVVLQVLGEVDRGHAALAQLALEAVAVGQGGGEALKTHVWLRERTSPVSTCAVHQVERGQVREFDVRVHVGIVGERKPTHPGEPGLGAGNDARHLAAGPGLGVHAIDMHGE